MGAAESSGRDQPRLCLVPPALKRKRIFRSEAFLKLLIGRVLPASPTRSHAHTHAHISDFPANKQSVISVIAQNVLFRLTRAKGMTPNRPPRKHFQEEFNGPDQGSLPEKPPQSHHPPGSSERFSASSTPSWPSAAVPSTPHDTPRPRHRGESK